jgi:hypothetical protein
LKLCKKCLTDKSLSEFYKNKQTKDGVRTVCKDCDNQRKLVYAKKNVESIALAKAEYKNKNREKTLSYLASWRKEYKHKMCVYASKRRAFLIGATPAWADKEKIELIYEEAAMLNKLNPKIKYEVDHIIPLKNNLVCGLHTHDNMQILLAADNRAKKNLFFIDGVQ